MYTWADLDNANKRDGTYNRRRCLLAQARKRLDDLEKREIEIIDAYEDGLMPFSEVKNIQREIMHAQRDYDRLRDLYNASEGIVHDHNVARIPPEWVHGELKRTWSRC